MDIFEYMKDQINCHFISDLPYMQKAVMKELEAMPPDIYTEEEIRKLLVYIFGKECFK